ncbi:hypothetical protein E2562_034746 [Oryza meyeriana var. granulata]|uniref:Uncharacterized protein n=1 Tax=Oryza meyeriana var. granulata TaxID=110450 RepID=A0A6G1CWF5_9ORYZ|nr:hypothetical protein E2562_034746 [Oryza meyeriana var. granulata]
MVQGYRRRSSAGAATGTGKQRGRVVSAQGGRQRGGVGATAGVGIVSAHGNSLRSGVGTEGVLLIGCKATG